MSATDAVLAFAAAPHRLAGDVRDAAVRLLTDTLAVGVAGSTAPGADSLVAAARLMGAGSEVPLLGRSARLLAPGAAMVNGFQIHCLEWDAVHEPAVVHAMSVVTAALHAVAHRAGGVDPEEALVALCVGVEIACLLGVSASSPLRFFRPATAGVMGAAVACGRLLGVTRLDDVLGMAHAQAAGTMQAHVEGSIALPVQVGLAARAAVTAVDLVRAGLCAPHDVLEGPFGYFPLFDEGQISPDGLGERWRISEISIKPWPCGRASHAVLGALQGKRPERIEAFVPPLVARLVGRRWITNMTAATARLCLPFLVACMLEDGHIDPRRFTPENFADPRLMALGERLTIAVDGNPDLNALSPQRVRLDGEDVHIPATLGSPLAPLSRHAHQAKIDLALSLAAEPGLFDPIMMLSGRLA